MPLTDQQRTFNASMPLDALFFSPDVPCPPGTEAVVDFSGRFLVGLPPSGASGATFGGPSIAAFKPQPPTTKHEMFTHVDFTYTSIGSGCCADGYAKTESAPVSGSTTDEAVHFPFMMARMCRVILP